MPTYDFQCRSCRHNWEGFARVAERNRAKCPKCGVRKSEVLVGASAPRTTNALSGDSAISIEWGFHPSEVSGVRKLMPNHQHCVNSRGDVKFRTVQEAASFKRRINEVRRWAGEGRYDKLGVSREFLTYSG